MITDHFCCFFAVVDVIPDVPYQPAVTGQSIGPYFAAFDFAYTSKVVSDIGNSQICMDILFHDNKQFIRP